MVNYTPGDWDLALQGARNQAVKRFADVVHAVDGYAVIAEQAGKHGDVLEIRKVHRALEALQTVLDGIGADRD